MQNDNLHQSTLQRLSYSKCQGKIGLQQKVFSIFSMNAVSTNLVKYINLSGYKYFSNVKIYMKHIFTSFFYLLAVERYSCYYRKNVVWCEQDWSHPLDSVSVQLFCCCLRFVKLIRRLFQFCLHSARNLDILKRALSCFDLHKISCPYAHVHSERN